jgi:DNA-binding response OmpR family regulator
MAVSYILLVEDDAVLSDLVRRNFQARGYDVYLAMDARSALAHLQAASVDLVIVDINLPDLSGWDVLRIALQRGCLHPQRLRECAEVATLPVIVLSAVRVSLARLHEFRPLAYLPKPFPLDALLRLVAEAAEQKGRHSSAFSTREEPEEERSPEPDEQATDRSSGLRRSFWGERRMIERLLSERSAWVGNTPTITPGHSTGV